ncbi:MAG TPA: hypothetical protein VK027_01175 [Chitinophagaceae bacterium]|nr:hypothetical protein [Chitinophagaceae bacterium]
MNIAIVTKTLALTGVTTHIMELTKNLTMMGHKVYLFSTGARDKESQANLALEPKFEKIGGIMINIPFPLQLTKTP